MDGVGIDEDAVALARELGGSYAKLTLAHVLTSDRPNGGADGMQSMEQLERAVALLGDARDKERSHDIGVEIMVQSIGSEWLADGLGDVARAKEADLIVIGSSRHALYRHVLLSEETRTALNGLPCSVAVAPAGFRMGVRGIQLVGAGADGSEEAADAVELARRVAEKHDARLVACTAVSVPLMAVAAGPLPVDDAISKLERDAVQRICSSYHAEPHVAYGPPAEVLASFSRAVDLLVIGSRRGGQSGEVAVGETFNDLTKQARCPVLVAPRTSGAPNG
jgi:nucleotide-binding universal stress UspA family protein